jgi:predicted Zn-dependent protease
MKALGKDQPPQWLSTHPSHDRRIEEIRTHLKDVLPLYAQARGVSLDRLPPYATAP